MWREQDGGIGAVDARCTHAGADLTRGRVAGNALHCPLHNRAITRSGCVRQRAYPVIERCGLVLAWRGDGPPDGPFPLPDGCLATSASQHLIAAPADLVAGNAFDAAHFPIVHRRQLIGPPRLETPAPGALRVTLRAAVLGTGIRDRILRRFGSAEVEIATECWGGSLLIFRHLRIGTSTVLGLLPVTPETTRVFALSLRPRPPKRLGRVRERLRLAIHHRAIMAFARQDLRAIDGSRAGPRDLDPLEDATLVAWFAHYHSLPRA